MSTEQENTLARQKLLLELNEKILKQKKDLDAQLEELTIEKEHIEGEKKKIEEKNAKLWEQSTAIHKEKERIDKLKQEVEARHTELMDSVHYAKRIQQAILPERNEIHQAFKNSFVLFKPKDVVSGDFFWFEEKNNKFFIAAVDCTGHGVPGALMSMLGTDKLNAALQITTEVNEILSELNKGVKKVLRQGKGEGSRDGMDIALCAFPSEMNKVEYAGANRPLWIIRNNSQEIEETKATKVAIGGFTEDDQQFTKHTYDLQKGDTIYIFTDGYADQFGGTDKKLMTKNLKNVLLSIQEKTMEEQNIHLDNFIETWKGNMEQTDDILMIGIKAG